jgi:type IV pilus assembly protein PilM
MGLFGKSKRIIGLDIGSSAIKAIEMAQRGDGLCITGYGKAVLNDPAENKAEAISRLLKTHTIKTKRSVTSVSGRSVIVRYVTMAQMSDENLQTAIKFEAD